MIFHLHTPELGGTMVYSHHIPRIGEKIVLRLRHKHDPDSTMPSSPLVGLFKVEDVLYTFPFDRTQQVDVYALKVGDVPADMSYSNVSKITYDHELSVISERRKKISG